VNKIKTLEELIGIVETEKAKGKTIAFANGVFDILHVGHVRYLKEAREMGDILIVAVNDDDSVRRLKGEGRPVMPAEERMEILSALSCVDYVIKFSEPTVASLLLSLKPHIQVKGTDYTEESVPERDVVMSYGGRVAIAGDPKDRSTTGYLARIKRGSS
jgi:rfaE bifunctional protein nucleotidyltransferase chain/domain